MAMRSTTFAADFHPAWMRWLLPSVADLVFVAMFCVLAFTNLALRLLGDAGIGWHIRTGQLILSTHAIPHVDPFSSSMAGHTWFAWEWLYDLLVGSLHAASGLNGVVVFTALIIALTFSIALRLMVDRGTNVLLALILVLLAASASMIHFFARPHVLSWLLTLSWFWILDSSAGNGSAVVSIPPQSPGSRNLGHNLLWLLPLTMLLWVNLHGGFLIGFALLVIYWLAAAWQWLRPAQDQFEQVLEKIRAGRRVRDLTFIGVLSFAATFLNPYGFRLHVHIYQYLSNPFLMDHIDEFQSPNFHYVAQKCFAILLLLTLVALVSPGRGPTNLRLSHRLLIVFAVYSGLYAARNIPVSSLLLILVIGPLLSDSITLMAASPRIQAMSAILKPREFLRRMQNIELGLRGHLWPIAAVVLTVLVLINGGKMGSRTLIDAHFAQDRFPAAAVDYIERQNLQEPVFSPDYWGGYLIYRLYPQRRVVIDDRHDFYGDSILKSYLKTLHVEPGWEDFLLQYPAQCLLVPKNSALANILTETTRWQPIYSDDVAVIFVPVPAKGE